MAGVNIPCHRSYGLTVLRSYGLTVLRSYGLTVLRSYGLTVLRSYGLTVLRSGHIQGSGVGADGSGITGHGANMCVAFHRDNISVFTLHTEKCNFLFKFENVVSFVWYFRKYFGSRNRRRDRHFLSSVVSFMKKVIHQ